MAKLQQLWGVALTAGLVGVGCTAAAPVGAPTAMGEGGGAATATLDAGVASGPIVEALSRADRYFITQYTNRRYNPNQKRANNANCGPTSLAMALRAFNREPSGLEDAGHAYELIRTVRRAMTGSTEENSWTYPIQVRDGARQFGLQAEIVFSVAEIQRAMAVPGRLMVVNLNPSPAYVDQLVTPYNGGHFALVTRIEGDQVYLNDPLAPHPIVISLAQLQTALTTSLGTDPNGNYIAPFDGGILLER